VKTPRPKNLNLNDNATEASSSFLSLIPARLDNLPWSVFHWQVLIALGITWVLDGLEVTLTGAVSGVLQDPHTLHFNPTQLGLLGSGYVAGAVCGSMIFGYLTDLLGRKKLFFVTLAVYVTGVLLSACSWNLWSFIAFRFLTGAGIGGEYAAINSAIDEIIPANVRGRVGLVLNGTYWLGAALGSLSTIWLLDTHHFAINTGWRIGFAGGGILGLSILFFRSFIPESPRWLVLRGRTREANEIVSDIEDRIFKDSGHKSMTPDKEDAVKIHPAQSTPLKAVFKTMLGKYRRRSILGLTLMTAQAFLYNAIFFTYALILTKFYNVPAMNTGLYLLPFAFGNFLGPLALGHLFDSIGRRKMITFTYVMSGALLALTGYLFVHGHLSATTQTLLWSIIFFFASAAASSAYLTVSEIFPLETRAIAIAVFFSLGTGIGGVVAPWLFGRLTESGSRHEIMWGYLFAGGLMVFAGVVEWGLGVNSERKSLESIAAPLASS
jgi:MFS family permease